MRNGRINSNFDRIIEAIRTQQPVNWVMDKSDITHDLEILNQTVIIHGLFTRIFKPELYDYFRAKYQDYFDIRAFVSDIFKFGESEIPPYTLKTLSHLFEIFHENKLLSVSKVHENNYYKIQFDKFEPHDIPSNLENKHKSLIIVIDDLLDSLITAIRTGNATILLNDSATLPLWEVKTIGTLFHSIMSVGISESINLLSKQKLRDELVLLNFSYTTGIEVAELIYAIIDHFEKISVKIYCYIEKTTLLSKMRENLLYFVNEIRDVLKDKALDVNIVFYNFDLDDIGDLPNSMANFVISSKLFTYTNPEKYDRLVKNFSRILKKDGIGMILQFTNKSRYNPHPFTILDLPVKNFIQNPTTKDLTKLMQMHFRGVKVLLDDMVWILQKPLLRA